MRRFKLQSGLSLIEIMITVALMGIILAMGVPYTISWMHSAEVQTAGNLLDQAYRQAKSLALRNPNAVVGTAPAAGVKKEGDLLLLCVGNPTDATCADGGTSVIWTATLPGNITVNANGSAMTVLRINSFGSPIDVSGDTISSNSYSITKGSQDDAKNLF